MQEVAAYRRIDNVGAGGMAQTLTRPFVPERLKWAAAAAAARTSSLAPRRRTARQTVVHHPKEFTSALKRQLHFVLEARLPELLHYEDRNSMAHSLEARVPFLDHRLVELAFTLDPSLLITRGRTKEILRLALADLLPDAVTSRVDKLGFETPESAWLRGDIGGFAQDVFRSRRFADRGLVDPQSAMSRLVRARRGGRAPEVWRALSVELWAREFFD
jgi:asparagine synthase (glutamine-hydrolysing)